jgi:hypothetical protein
MGKHCSIKRGNSSTEILQDGYIKYYEELDMLYAHPDGVSGWVWRSAIVTGQEISAAMSKLFNSK